MWWDLFVEVARERREVFKNLGEYLVKIAEVVKELDRGRWSTSLGRWRREGM